MLVHSVNSSVLITSFSVKPELVTIGLRATTLKVLNLSTLSSMLFVRKLKVAIAFKVSNWYTPLVVVPDPVWEHF